MLKTLDNAKLVLLYLNEVGTLPSNNPQNSPSLLPKSGTI